MVLPHFMTDNNEAVGWTHLSRARGIAGGAIRARSGVEDLTGLKGQAQLIVLVESELCALVAEALKIHSSV